MPDAQGPGETRRIPLPRFSRVLVLAFALLIVPAGHLSAAPLAGDTASETKTADRRIYLGMWTVHFRDLGRGIENNWLVGVSWRGIYAATFINTFGDRAYSAGYQGILARWSPGVIALGLGYRVGFITGYDERLTPIAGKVPVLPLVQPRLAVDVKRVGLELSHSAVVTSAGFNVRF